MDFAGKRALVELPIRFQSPQGIALLAVFCATAPIEFILICSVVLVLVELLRLLLGTPPAHHVPKQLESPPHSAKQMKRPRANSAVAASCKHLGATEDVPLDADAMKRDAAVSVAVGIITSVQKRYLSDDAKLPVIVGGEAELKTLGPGLLGGSPAVESVVDVISAATAVTLPGARILHGGCACPKVDVVIIEETATLAKQLQNRLKRGIRAGDVSPVTSSKLQKSALRYCINLLVSKGFKFRRSAFKADEPVISLLAPDHLGGVHVNISVNNPIPLLNAALIREASAADSRVLPLVASVQRWADARGLAHPHFGPLSSYAWTHVVIFFLQKHMDPPMPPLGGPHCKVDSPPPDAALLHKFFEFCTCFSWGEQCISIRGECWSPEATIADAFREGVDLGHNIQPSSAGRKQLQAEAAIAMQRLLENGATVSDLLEHPIHGAKFGSGALPSAPHSVAPPPGLSEITEMPFQDSQWEEPPKARKSLPWRSTAVMSNDSQWQEPLKARKSLPWRSMAVMSN